jgi:hypothetical protein
MKYVNYLYFNNFSNSCKEKKRELEEGDREGHGTKTAKAPWKNEEKL